MLASLVSFSQEEENLYKQQTTERRAVGEIQGTFQIWSDFYASSIYYLFIYNSVPQHIYNGKKNCLKF